MIKKICSFTLLAALITGGLVGCNTNEEAMRNGNVQTDEFYEDVNNRNQPLGHVDYEYIGEKNYQNVDKEPTTLGNRFRREDYNYHGQMNKPYNNMNRTYTNMRQKRIAQRISNRLETMNGINNVRTIMTGTAVYVAIDSDTDVNDQEIREIVQHMTVGRNVEIYIERNAEERILKQGLENPNLDVNRDENRMEISR